MKSYLLLRDNHQSGPYTLEEIKVKALQPLDLVWIEGVSTCWMYPQEVEELKMFVKSRKRSIKARAKEKTVQVAAITTTKIPTAESKLISLTSGAAIGTSTVTARFENYNPYQETDRDLFHDYKTPLSIKTGYTFRSNLVALLILVIGVAMTAFVVKNIVESFGNQPLSSGQATQIESINYESQHAAMASAPVNVQPAVLAQEVLPTPTSVLPVQKTEVTNIATDSEKKPLKMEAISDPIVEKPAKPDEVKDNSAAAVAVEEKKETEPKEASKKDVKSLLNVSANDYKVGVLGGVSNLQIRVSNSSTSTVDATVEVLFYKPNGSVVNKETVQVSNISPGGSKSVSVPPSSRGVKVSYRVLDANAG